MYFAFECKIKKQNSTMSEKNFFFLLPRQKSTKKVNLKCKFPLNSMHCHSIRHFITLDTRQIQIIIMVGNFIRNLSEIQLFSNNLLCAQVAVRVFCAIFKRKLFRDFFSVTNWNTKAAGWLMWNVGLTCNLTEFFNFLTHFDDDFN